MVCICQGRVPNRRQYSTVFLYSSVKPNKPNKSQHVELRYPSEFWKISNQFSSFSVSNSGKVFFNMCYCNCLLHLLQKFFNYRSFFSNMGHPHTRVSQQVVSQTKHFLMVVFMQQINTFVSAILLMFFLGGGGRQSMSEIETKLILKSKD